VGGNCGAKGGVPKKFPVIGKRRRPVEEPDGVVLEAGTMRLPQLLYPKPDILMAPMRLAYLASPNDSPSGVRLFRVVVFP